MAIDTGVFNLLLLAANLLIASFESIIFSKPFLHSSAWNFLKCLGPMYFSSNFFLYIST